MHIKTIFYSFYDITKFPNGELKLLSDYSIVQLYFS